MSREVCYIYADLQYQMDIAFSIMMSILRYLVSMLDEVIYKVSEISICRGILHMQSEDFSRYVIMPHAVNPIIAGWTLSYQAS